MKSFFLILFVVVSVTSLRGQQDTIIVTEEEDIFQPEEYIDASDYLFLTQEETKWLFKTNFLEVIPPGENNINLNNPWDGPAAAFERKITSAFSINAFVDLSLTADATITIGENRSENFWESSGITLGLEPRYYFQMNKIISSGKGANNLSGNYFSLRSSNFFRADTTGVNFDNTGLSLRFGLQRRVFKYGYVDISVGGGMKYGERRFSDKGFSGFFDTEVAVGFALGQRASYDYSDRYCDVLKCYIEERKLWKVDLLSLLTYSQTEGQTVFLFRPSIAYERKLGSSSWSLNFNFQSELGTFRLKSSNGVDPGFETIKGYSYLINFGIEPRYYYNLKKRVADGRSANNLSANFITIIARTYIKGTTSTSASVSNTVITTGPQIGFAWGLQRRFLKYGFLDLKLGLASEGETFIEGGPVNGNGGDVNIIAIGEIKIGIAF